MESVAWDEASSELGRPERVHAVGAFALYYNELELALYGLFQQFIPVAHEARAYIFLTLHNGERANLVNLFANKDPDRALVAAINHATRCFDICAENRKVILPALAGPRQEPARVPMTLLDAGREDPESLKTPQFELEELREAALGARATASYFRALCAFITSRKSRRPEGWPPLMLPRQPSLPKNLSTSSDGSLY